MPNSARMTLKLSVVIPQPLILIVLIESLIAGMLEINEITPLSFLVSVAQLPWAASPDFSKLKMSSDILEKV